MSEHKYSHCNLCKSCCWNTRKCLRTTNGAMWWNRLWRLSDAAKPEIINWLVAGKSSCSYRGSVKLFLLHTETDSLNAECMCGLCDHQVLKYQQKYKQEVKNFLCQMPYSLKKQFLGSVDVLPRADPCCTEMIRFSRRGRFSVATICEVCSVQHI